MIAILAIDPGPRNQGWVLYRTDHRTVMAAGNFGVDDMLTRLTTIAFRARGNTLSNTEVRFAVEEVQNYGNVVGKDVFLTVRNSGRFQQAWFHAAHNPNRETWFCSFQRARTIMGLPPKTKESGVRAWMRDSLAAWHGIDPKRVKGTKNAPGPCYGVSDHAWSALHVAIAYDIDQLKADYAF